MRPLAVAALTAAVAPLVFGLVAVRPVAAQETPPGYASYGLTGLAAGVRTAGTVGASGGLVTLDTGSGQVAARLDSSPSAGVLAAPYEPGTLFRTVVGQVNAGAGETVFDVPDAEAAFPGTGTGAVALVPPSSGGPLSGAGGSAVASADARSAEGSATGSALAVDGALQAEGSTSSVELAVDPDGRTTTATGRTAVGRVVVGVLELRDVVATASITSRGDSRTTTASLTVGGASVAGMPVGLTDDGVEALGTPLLPGQTVRDLTAQANAALERSGVQVRTIEAVRSSDRRSASVDTGGVVVTLATPDLAGGVAANRLEVVVGGVQLTGTDEPAVAGAVLPAVPPAVPPAPALPPATAAEVPGTPGVPGTAAQPGLPALPPAPALPAAPAVAAPAGGTVLVAGRAVPAAAALAGFAVWQFLSLSTATLYAVVERRRRLAQLEELA